MVHVTAGRIDPGWEGQIVLEFYNNGKLPLALRPGMSICALSFEMLSSPALRPFNKRTDTKYKGQQGDVSSRIARELQIKLCNNYLYTCMLWQLLNQRYIAIFDRLNSFH